MRCGSQVASNGNAIRMTSRMRSVATNGITPLKIVAKDTSLTTLLMTKTFMPTGGWINPSSTVITMITQHQIHQHDQGEDTVAAEAKAGKKLRHLLRGLRHRQEIAEDQRADQHRKNR